MRRIRKFLRDQDGPTAVEYAVMLACILIVCIASITLVGGGTYNFWNYNRHELESALGGS